MPNDLNKQQSHVAALQKFLRGPLQSRMLIPIAATIIVLVTIFTIATVYQTRRAIESSLSSLAVAVNQMYASEIDRTDQVMAVSLNLIKNDIRLMRAFAKRDIEASLEASLWIHQMLSNKYGITHFYLHLPNRTVFLRAHKPSEFGDLITRESLKLAENLSHNESEAHITPIFAVEQGSIGRYAIRSVIPWHDGRKLLGYIELGREMQSVTESIKKDLDVDLLLMVQKKALSREQYESAAKEHGEFSNWNELPEDVVISRTMTAIPPTVARAISNPHHSSRHNTHEPIKMAASFNGKSLHVVSIPVTSLNNPIPGELLVIKDYSALHSKIQNALAMIVIIAITLGGVLIFLFHGIVKSLSRHLSAISEELDESHRTAIHLARLSAIGEMASSIIHEISNPLLVIAFESQSVKKKIERAQVDPAGLPYEAVRKSIVQIEKMVMRIDTIAKSMRKSARKSESDPLGPFSVDSLIQDAVDLIMPKFHFSGVKLTVNPLGENIQIDCRAIQLSQAIMNLLSNAVDATESHNERWARIDASDLGDKVEISVTDSGSGIPQEVQVNLFKTFFTTKSSGKGTGLGLTIVRDIVVAHQGQIFIDNQSPNTRFVVHLPRSMAQSGASDVTNTQDTSLKRAS